MFDNFVFPNENLSAETMDFDLISWTATSTPNSDSFMDNLIYDSQVKLGTKSE